MFGRKLLCIKKKFFIKSNLDQLSTNTIFNYPEQENAPARIFLKIVACHSAYKKKLEEAIVKAILNDLLILKFDNFTKPEFILKYLIFMNIILFYKFFSI